MANRQTSQRIDVTERILTSLAWAGILALIILTIVPANERPVTTLSHTVEHMTAFAVVGTLVGLSFRMRPLTLFTSAIVFAACLELIQISLPTRHARLADFFDNSIGSWIGLTVGYCLSLATLRRGD